MIVAGFGFRARATQDSLTNALAKTGAHPTHLATVQAKANHPALRALAAQLKTPIVAVQPAVLAEQSTQTQSLASLAAHQTGSVSEAAALAAAEPGAQLIAARAISDDTYATCAIATGDPT
ncbi:MAG: cobalamin biosynthesis protein [Paracoccaceae bacterium]